MESQKVKLESELEAERKQAVQKEVELSSELAEREQQIKFTQVGFSISLSLCHCLYV